MECRESVSLPCGMCIQTYFENNNLDILLVTVHVNTCTSEVASGTVEQCHSFNETHSGMHHKGTAYLQNSDFPPNYEQI